ncbi:MAG: sulfatase-like hydrolase/transferase, partial [Pirellulaceae bacterium]
MWTMWSGFIAVWTVGVFVHGVIRADEVRRPNVLLIVSEDNGLQFGCYGDKTVPTPHVDRLAASGVRFANAYVTQAVCSPSRSSILTGLYPHQNGQLGLATHRFTMVREWPTLPTLLHSAGYRTGLLGKLHVLPESAFQFDVRWADASAISFSQRDVHRTADQVRDFIQGSGEQPFFLMVNFADTHLPFLPQSHGVPSVPVRPEQVVTMPAVGVDTPRLRRETADYYSCVQRLDEGVGLVLSALEQSGQSDRTLVIFVGDHGPQ